MIALLQVENETNPAFHYCFNIYKLNPEVPTSAICSNLNGNWVFPVRGTNYVSIGKGGVNLIIDNRVG